MIAHHVPVGVETIAGLHIQSGGSTGKQLLSLFCLTGFFTQTQQRVGTLVNPEASSSTSTQVLPDLKLYCNSTGEAVAAITWQYASILEDPHF